MYNRYTRFLFIVIVLSYSFLLQNCSDYSAELSGGYKFISESENSKHIVNDMYSGNDIFGKIISYDFNSNFIVALQKPDINDYKSMIATNIRFVGNKYINNTLQDVIASEIEADSIIRNDSFYIKLFSSKVNYWIISHKENKRYGPFDKIEYEKKRIELKIPESVRVNNIE